ncbi:hypothetical protein DY000_02009586 [Brassica cretica]|uniref:Uncharacterized protein n=1 Tax=Brassica cretica TaxID=69181 RepID=A0ABQ7C711_BRACR|nr:hypothetical protein DY000_02009586 [Brassica cretica]
MAMVVIGSLPSSLHPPPLPSRFRPPPDLPPCLPCLMSFEVLSPPLCLSFLVPSEALSPPEPPDPPPCLPFRVPFEALSPPEPPNPPDPSCRLFVSALCNVLLADVLFGVVTVLLPFIPSPQARIQISTLKPPSRMATKNVGSGGLLAYGLHSFVVYMSPFGCVDYTSFAYGLHSPVIYMSLFGCVDWSSISSCFDLPTTPHCKVLHAHLSYVFSTYTTTVEWFRQLFVWLMLELRFMILAGDRPMGLVSFGSTFVTSSSIYIALARSSAVCSSLTGSISDVGVVFVYLCSWWQVEEKPIVTFIPMNMEVAGYSPLVPRLSQSYFLIFPPLWSELDEQASLVLQGSSSLRMLFSAYGAVCVVLRVTLDSVFEEAYDVVVIRFHLASFWDLYRLSILYLVVVVCLAVNSLFVSSFVGV